MLFYENCTLCPRECKVDRTKNLGFCKESDKLSLSWCGLHKGEEGAISGKNGSGMLFFTGCTLGCPTCQNIQISSVNRDKTIGYVVSIDECVNKTLALQEMGASTISFVTAEHFAPSVCEIIQKAKDKGLDIPIVFNTSGYMKIEAIKMLLPYVDVWLWDMKTLSTSLAKKYFGCQNYPKVEERGLEFLVSKIKKTDIECEKPYGILVRHLVLPSFINESIDVIKHFSKNYKDFCAFSLMYQFIPPKNTFKELEKPITKEDTEALENVVFDEGIENGFIQELSENEQVWQPDFTRPNPFPSSYAVPLTSNL